MRQVLTMLRAAGLQIVRVPDHDDRTSLDGETIPPTPPHMGVVRLVAGGATQPYRRAVLVCTGKPAIS